MRLNHLANKILLSDTKKLASSERVVITKLLHHLKEIERRKLYHELNYSSLFAYCVRELGYSESGAQRRIVAARALAEMPEIEPKIESGKLTLTNISLVNDFIEDKSQRQEVLKEVEGLTKTECEKRLFEITGKEKKPGKAKRISKDKIQEVYVLSDETMATVEKLKDLLGKNLSMDELVQFMAKEAMKSLKRMKSLPPAKVDTTVTMKTSNVSTSRQRTRTISFNQRLI
ncbi:hypothetical protein [Peredibacter starrii]|uniref:Uncharacterized protein n=1 Tax=Peredibacter starrii TaxID=28202 RepID=A0AAX4HUR6_9BACT|nr:hypothetical protein [Peredibacter starrii]WPU66971.1 hypothetical protein SOO65_09430 [Peredibacter starrii]